MEKNIFKNKYISAALTSAILLCGCNPNPDSSSEQTAPADTAADTSVTAETVSSAETKPVTHVTEAEEQGGESVTSTEAGKTVLMRLVQTAASEGNSWTFDITEELFGDFDGDGRSELIAQCGGYYWYTDGKNTYILRDEFNNMKLAGIEIGGRTIITMTTYNKRYTYLYTMKNGELTELEASGKFGEITDNNGVFTAVCHAWDDTVSIERGHTWKNYWLYFEDGEFKEYVGEKITKADFMKYTGAKAVLDGIEAEGGTVTDILYRKNEVVNVNYTVTESDAEYNKFYAFDVSGGDCKEIKSLFEDKENNYGVYLPSAINPYDGEQLALHQLIELTSGGNPWDEVIYPLFGDFDGDGKNELIAAYGDYGSSELWFASGGRAYKMGERETVSINSGRSVPVIVKFAGSVYFMTQLYYPGTMGGMKGICDYYLIKNSSASKVEGETAQNLVSDGDYGDLISDEMMYDLNFEYDENGEFSTVTGQTWKKFWYYILDGEIHEYYGKEITREEFLKYDGAAEVLEKIADGYEIDNILKRGNGIINVNYSKKSESKYRYVESFDHTTVRYRQGKVIAAEEYSEQGGTYYGAGDSDRTEQTDFERFCEMIFDTAEGDENSRIRERFFGDFNSDGKNELYAYYGTDEKFSLWFADENGAKTASETEAGKSAELFIADGDTLLKISRSEKQPDILEYYIIQNGKSKRLDNFGAKRLLRSENGDFTGLISAEDTYSDNTVKTEKEYWFYYKNGAFHDYTAKEITEEQLAEYKGARAALDEITSMGGEVVSILQRENGIININYDSHRQDLTLHYYLTLKIDDKGRAENITPKKDDGTLDNSGYYLSTLRA